MSGAGKTLTIILLALVFIGLIAMIFIKNANLIFQ
jgi:cbb3-type cytochrome oxidase subunit 3